MILKGERFLFVRKTNYIRKKYKELILREKPVLTRSKLKQFTTKLL